MKALLILGMLAVFGTAVFATPASAVCQWGRFSVMWGSDGPAMANADSGQRCLLRVRAGNFGSFSALGVVRQAKHGAVNWNGSSLDPAYTYRSAPGYKGPDDFVVYWDGSNSRLGLSGKSNISVSMDVQ
jgi:hypothetical protein